MNFIPTLHARRKGLRTLTNHFPDSRFLHYDKVFEKGKDVPFNCHRDDLCSEIAN